MKNLYKSGVLFLSVAALVALLIVLDVYMYRYSPALFWVSFPLLVAVSGMTIGKLLQIRKSEFWYFEQLTNEIHASENMSMISFPLPLAVVDSEGCIVWSNDCFHESFYVPDKDESSIYVVTDYSLELFGSEGRVIQFEDRWYCVYSDRHEFVLADKKPMRTDGKRKAAELVDGGDVQGDEESESLTMLIFRDITDYHNLNETKERTKPIVMVLLVDNYEELLSGAKESERANVNIQVDRLVEDYFAEKKALVRKISSDKFFIVVEQQYLREMYAEKMSIINKAHEIIVRDRAVVTLSIGIGETAETLAEGERFAEEMLVKALERGGDQALVKTKSGFTAYGAISPGKARTGKVKIRLAAENIKNLINTADTVYIMGHSYGDFDSAGSAIGLTCAIRRLGIPAYTVARFKDERKTNAKALFDRFREYDNFVAIEPEEAERSITPKSVLIIVDTHIEKKVEDPDLLEMCSKGRLVVIDHHRLSAGAITDPAVKIHESNASSASELVTELVQYLSGDPLLTGLEAEALLAGIMLDTKDFVMRAGVSTFEAAAYLKKLGADTIAVKKLFDTTIESKTRRAEIISAAEIYHDNCAISVVTEDFPGIRVVCSQAADEMLYIKNVDAAFTVYPIENGWSFSARSLGKVNVQVVMEALGNRKDDGGGHQSMAGAQLYGITMEEAVEKLHSAIDEYFAPAPEENEQAGE